MAAAKRILMVPMDKKVEALRMASGLTLLDDQVAIASWGPLPEGQEVAEQMEALDFADVPVEQLDRDMDALAARILNSDVVLIV